MIQDGSVMHDDTHVHIESKLAAAISEDIKKVNIESLSDSESTTTSTASYVPESHASGLSLASESDSLQHNQELDVDEFFERKTSGRTSKTVSWGTTETRLFPIIPGDHPDARGAPLTIAWDPVKQVRQTVDVYERERKEVRTLDGLRLDWLERHHVLRRLGTSDEDIAEALECSFRVRKQRERTLRWDRFSRLEEFHQSFFRKVGRMLNPNKAKLTTKY